jgi:hypothetical protein
LLQALLSLLLKLLSFYLLLLLLTLCVTIMHFIARALFFAAVLAIPVVLAQELEDFKENPDFKAEDYKVGKDGKSILTGPPGVFDDYEGNDNAMYKVAEATKNDTRAGTCADYMPAGSTAKLVFCVNDGAGGLTTGTCTSAGQYPVFAKCGKNDYDAQLTCNPLSASKPQGTGKCMSKSNAAVLGKFFAKAKDTPCDYFADIMQKKGEKCGYFCIGSKGNMLLQCPENKISKCDGGCRTLMEDAAAGTKVQCGKAACKAAGYD